MRLVDFINKSVIIDDLKSVRKKEVLSELLDVLVKLKKITPQKKSAILKQLLEREKLGSTAVGQNFAIPHTKTKLVSKVSICIGRSKKGVDFDSLDGEPVYIFFLFIVPEKEFGLHLKLLAECARMLRDKYFRKQLLEAKNRNEMYEIIVSRSKS